MWCHAASVTVRVNNDVSSKHKQVALLEHVSITPVASDNYEAFAFLSRCVERCGKARPDQWQCMPATRSNFGLRWLPLEALPLQGERFQLVWRGRRDAADDAPKLPRWSLAAVYEQDAHLNRLIRREFVDDNVLDADVGPQLPFGTLPCVVISLPIETQRLIGLGEALPDKKESDDGGDQSTGPGQRRDDGPMRTLLLCYKVLSIVLGLPLGLYLARNAAYKFTAGDRTTGTQHLIGSACLLFCGLLSLLQAVASI